MLSLVQSIPFSQTSLLPKLVGDYLRGESSLKHLYNYPQRLDAFEQVMRDKQRDNTNRKLLVEVLQAQYSRLAEQDAVARNIASLQDENTFTVCAAHQPNLLLGPLYTVVKICCAINITQQLKLKFPDRNFVPVYWLGSEDHDFEELNHANLFGKKLEWKEERRGAIGRLPTTQLQVVFDELRQLLNTGEQTNRLLQMLESGLVQQATFGAFTQHFVHELFKDFGLVVLNQDDVKLKKQFAPVIKDEVLHQRATSLLKENVAFLDANYRAQAQPRDINFFYLTGNARERIVWNEAQQVFQVNNTALSFSQDEMVNEIEAHPGRFSPNVILRPLYQEMTLPNLAFVGGAGELSYWLELKPVFDHYKVNYPMLIQRNVALLLSTSTQKKLEKLGLPLLQFFGDVEVLINLFIQQQSSDALSLAKEKEQLIALFDAVQQKAETLDPTLKASVSGEKQKLLNALENIENKMLKAEKRKQETSVQQIRAVHAAIFPEGTLQERHENFIPFYLKQGNDFIASLVRDLNPFDESVKVFGE